MPRAGIAPVRRLAACLAVSCLVAACGTTGSSSSGSSKSSSVTAIGSTLSIWLSVPPGATPAEQDVLDAEKLAFAAKSRQVTGVGLRLRIAQRAELSANAREAIQDKSAIAYLGELVPGSSEDTVGITNALDLLQVSPTDTALELTSASGAVPGAPNRYYETLSTYGRTFARVAPSSAAEAAAQVAEMRKLNLKTLYVTDDGSDYGKAIAGAVRHDATAASLTMATSASAADAEFVGAQTLGGARRSVAAASAAKVFLPSALALGAPAAQLANVGGGEIYVSVPSPPAGAASQVAAFQKAFRTAYAHAPSPQAVFGYEAMSAVLAVLRQAGGSVKNRSIVVRDFHKFHAAGSVLGSYSVDKAGDSSLATFRFLRLKSGTLVPIGRTPIQG